MEVSCSQCSTRYRVPDERVQGRKVRLPCRRCGNFILIDQREPGRQSAPLLPGAHGAFAEAKPERWHVSLLTGVEELTLDEIAERCRAETLFAETHVWRSGMAEWKMIGDVPALGTALLARGVRFRPPSMPPEPAQPAPRPDLASAESWESEKTRVLRPKPPLAAGTQWDEPTRVLEEPVGARAAGATPLAAGDSAPTAARIRDVLVTSDDRRSSEPPPLPPEPRRPKPPPLPPPRKGRSDTAKLTRAEAVAPVRPPAAAQAEEPVAPTVVLAAVSLGPPTPLMGGDTWYEIEMPGGTWTSKNAFNASVIFGVEASSASPPTSETPGCRSDCRT